MTCSTNQAQVQTVFNIITYDRGIKKIKNPFFGSHFQHHFILRKRGVGGPYLTFNWTFVADSFFLIHSFLCFKRSCTVPPPLYFTSSFVKEGIREEKNGKRVVVWVRGWWVRRRWRGEQANRKPYWLQTEGIVKWRHGVSSLRESLIDIKIKAIVSRYTVQFSRSVTTMGQTHCLHLKSRNVRRTCGQQVRSKRLCGCVLTDIQTSIRVN